MSEHVIPPKVYLAVFAALMVLTALTVWVAFQDFEPLNTAIALGIAGLKAVLVVLYFMHVRYGTRLTWVFSAVGFLWLFILIGLTLSDILTRHWEYQPAGWGPTGTIAPAAEPLRVPGLTSVPHRG